MALPLAYSDVCTIQACAHLGCRSLMQRQPGQPATCSAAACAHDTLLHLWPPCHMPRPSQRVQCYTLIAWCWPVPAIARCWPLPANNTCLPCFTVIVPLCACYPMCGRYVLWAIHALHPCPAGCVHYFNMPAPGLHAVTGLMRPFWPVCHAIALSPPSMTCTGCRSPTVWLNQDPLHSMMCCSDRVTRLHNPRIVDVLAAATAPSCWAPR